LGRADESKKGALRQWVADSFSAPKVAHMQIAYYSQEVLPKSSVQRPAN
jgi:hypothetical protein